MCTYLEKATYGYCTINKELEIEFVSINNVGSWFNVYIVPHVTTILITLKICLLYNVLIDY